MVNEWATARYDVVVTVGVVEQWLTGGGMAVGLPRYALAVDAALIAQRYVLVYGDMRDDVTAALEGQGVALVRARTVADAVSLLASETFDAVALDPRAEAALDIVRAAKFRDAGPDLTFATVCSAADRHAAVPFFVMPFPDEDEYAVLIKPPRVAFLESESRIPLATAVIRLDARKLLARLTN